MSEAERVDWGVFTKHSHEQAVAVLTDRLVTVRKFRQQHTHKVQEVWRQGFLQWERRNCKNIMRAGSSHIVLPPIGRYGHRHRGGGYENIGSASPC